MLIKTVQDILPLVEKPSTYLGNEINSIRKRLDTVQLRFALAFPDLYEIGTSHFGMQIIYHILNEDPQIAAERVFTPASDMEEYLRLSGLPLTTLESQTPLSRFDIIGFSLLYELNYTNILTMFELGKIPFFARERDSDAPIVIAGGPCTCNPEPIADLFDAMVVGDGEGVVTEMTQAWIRLKKTGNPVKQKLLTEWSGIEGVYIPAFYQVTYNPAGFQVPIPGSLDQTINKGKVSRAVYTDLDKAPFPGDPVIPYGKPVHDRLRLEVSRGCSRGCRFCQAGMIYRPVRERSPDTLLAQTEKCLASTGYEDISLLSLSTGDYQCLIPLMARLMDQSEYKNIAVSLPSLRADRLTPDLMKQIKRVRKTGFTIAPEAGSQRLRDIINKNITEREIADTVKHAFNLGWQRIKLYFMIGLPYETDDDLRSIVELVKNLRKASMPKKKNGKINVSIATFVPKPHTPFQWTSQITRLESKEKITWLRRNLKLPGVHVKWQNPDVSFLEGLWARGDRRLAPLLIKAYQKGCRFDGWSDKFQYNRWETALSEAGVDIDFFTTRKRNLTEPLPWDYIDIKISKDFLKEEWKRAEQGNSTLDCRWGDCHGCGVCNFRTIQPRIFKRDAKKGVTSLNRSGVSVESKSECSKKFKIIYAKLEPGKYFGHLELVNIFLRALRRAKISIKYSTGFHPMPKVSFDDPLPVGMESQNEVFFLTTTDMIEPEDIKKGLNHHLPPGIVIHDCEIEPSSEGKNENKSIRYQIVLRDAVFKKNELERFCERTELIVSRLNRKGKLKKSNIKDMVETIQLLSPEKLEITLGAKKGRMMRPMEVVRNIFTVSEQTLRQAKIVKMKKQYM